MLLNWGVMPFNIFSYVSKWCLINRRKYWFVIELMKYIKKIWAIRVGRTRRRFDGSRSLAWWGCVMRCRGICRPGLIGYSGSRCFGSCLDCRWIRGFLPWFWSILSRRLGMSCRSRFSLFSFWWPAPLARVRDLSKTTSFRKARCLQ